MKQPFCVRTERTVPLADLDLLEVLVLPEYEIEAESQEIALEEFYWHAPIINHEHFKVQVFEARH